MAKVFTPKHCQACGGRLIAPLQDDAGGPPLVCGDCGLNVYLDPKLAVAGVVPYHGGVLLLRRAQHDVAHGRWILPGGHVDQGEVVPQAALREVAEETGLTVEMGRLLGIYSYAGNPVVLVVYLIHPVKGELVASPEALELTTFSQERIPWDELGYVSTGQALNDYFAALSRNPA